MAPSLPDDSVFEEEEGVRTDVQIAIDLALSDVLDDPRERDITDVESEKLTHFATRDCDLPLTYSWYLAGVHSVVEPSPDTQSPWEPGRSFGGINAQESQYNERVRNLRDYFRSTEFIPGYTLRDIWFEDKFVFLRDYYRELAPDEYRNLYLHSIDLREKLWNLNEILDRESANQSLDEFGAGVSITLLDSSTEEEIRYLISDYHMDLANIDVLSQIKKDVIKGTDLIERVLSKLTRIETTNVEQRSFLESDLHDLYYYYVWKYAALAISADTAAGPHAEELKQKRLLEFDNFDEPYHTELDETRQQARELDLLPQTDEPLSEDSEKSEYLHHILKVSIDSRDK